MNNIINLYIKKIKIDDIDKFAKNNNITLSNEELKYIYNLKFKYSNILENEDKILIESKSFLSSDNYNKIKDLLEKYKKRYKDYL